MVIEFLKKNIGVLCIVFFAIVASLPLFHSGFFTVHDDVQVARIYEMAKSLFSGQFPVRWVSDLGYGLGYPIFNFYSVLPYYIGGALALAGLDVLLVTKAVFVIGIIASGVSMYFLAKTFFGTIPAFVSSFIYLYFPYHAVNIYVRGDLAELFAYAILPLVFLSLFKIHTSSRLSKKYIVLGTLSIAAVVLSHNLSAFMLFIFIGIFTIYSLISGRNKKNLFLSYTFILALAFLLSAFYAVPAVLESKYTNVMSVIGGGSDWRDHFLCLSQFWDSQWGFGGSAAGCVDGMSFKLGKLNVLLLLVAILLAFIERKRFREKGIVVFYSIASLVISVFMTQENSFLLWTLPYMEFLQFPWRFLNFVGLFGSIIIGALVWVIFEKTHSKIGLAIAFSLIALTLASNKGLFVPQGVKNVDSNFYTNSYYLNWTASKISDEYLPKNFIRPKSQSEIPASMNLFNDHDNGLYIKTPDGTKFGFKQTPVQIASNILSIVGVIALSAVIIWKKNPFYGKKTP